jgi:hypothetical protein
MPVQVLPGTRIELRLTLLTVVKTGPEMLEHLTAVTAPGDNGAEHRGETYAGARRANQPRCMPDVRS